MNNKHREVSDKRSSGDNEISAIPVPKGGISAVIVNFMNGIYMDERGERMDYKVMISYNICQHNIWTNNPLRFQRKQFLGTIC